MTAIARCPCTRRIRTGTVQRVTIPDLPAGRPIPDTDDLRLLAELINNAYIPLANAAWNARMSQQEAAARLVSMAERGLPLRLVADGDRQALWRIAQAGPATSGVPVTGDPAHPGAAMPAPGPAGAAAGSGGAPSVAAQLSTAPPIAMPPSPAGAGSAPGVPGAGVMPAQVPLPGMPVPVVLPPASPVPPHEQAIAGAVPLGQPPFGQPDPSPPSGQGAAGTEATPEAEEPGAPDGTEQPATPGTVDDSGSTGEAEPATEAASDADSPWGPAGSSWVRTDDADAGSAEQPAAPSAESAAGSAAQPPAESGAEPLAESGAEPGGESGASSAESASGAHRAPDVAGPGYLPGPGTPVPPFVPVPTPPRWAAQSVTGPAGERLVVTILDMRDPGDEILTDAGYRMEPGQRAVLVHSSVANTGDAPYYPVGDLNLVLETDQQVLLGRANVAVASHPAFGVGVAPGHTADGWSVFLIPSETRLAGLKWCIRPDFPQTILSWPVAP